MAFKQIKSIQKLYFYNLLPIVMKKVWFQILVILLLVNAVNMSAQILRYKATSFSVLEKTSKNNWGDWSEFEPSTVVIVVDAKKSRIVFNSREIQLFKIMSFGEPIVSKNAETLILNCIDNDRGSCTIIIVTKKNEDDRVQFYVNYDDVKMVYNVYKTE